MLLSKMSEKEVTVIGLTGVMGAGKSTVINILKDHQIPVLDCDKINAELMLKGKEGYQYIKEAFPTTIFDEQEEIDKQALSKLIFHDKNYKIKLERIQHPLIKNEIIRIIKSMEAPLVVVEVPLLFEIAWDNCFDEIWVVACPEEIILERLMKYRNISYTEAKLRLSHQMSQDEKISKADYVLYNHGHLKELEGSIEKLLERGNVNEV